MAVNIQEKNQFQRDIFSGTPGREESIYFGRKRGENLSKYSYSLTFCERISDEGESFVLSFSN
jgi:hypothetical protein